jgi:CRISPR/Cas system CMR-associated protein Cmr3 (group 5 of RAMP superfamily)
MTIQFYLNNEEETQITSFYDIQSNPFKVGDVIHLNVEELYPIDYNHFKEDFKIKMINDNKKLENLFKRKEVKIVKEGKWVEFKVAKEPKLVIHINR